jgi:hypothetical protein
MALYYEEIDSSPEPDSIDFSNFVEVATILSKIMYVMGIRHAFIGGFACCVLGSLRQTEHVDCCVQAGWKQIQEVVEAEKQ